MSNSQNSTLLKGRFGRSHHAIEGARLIAYRLVPKKRLPRVMGLIPQWIKKLILWVLAQWVSLCLVFRRDRLTRILGVWNFNEQTGSLGDSLVFQEVLNVLCRECRAEKVDLCYIDDPTHKNAKNVPYLRSPLMKRTMQSTWLVNPSIGSVFHFDSDTAFKRFVRDSFYDYLKIWPDASGNKVGYDVRVIEDFFKRNKYFPYLRCKPETVNWALDFVEEKVHPALPIVVGFRNNTRMPQLNTDINCWGQFFQHYVKDTRFKFIIVCYKEEVVDELREFPNVVISKDHGTDFEKDCGLIQVSHACVKSTSGMGIFCFFSGVPTLDFGLCYTHPSCYALKDYESWNFLSPFQKQFWGPPTAEKVIREFDHLIDELEKVRWRNPSVRAELPIGEGRF